MVLSPSHAMGSITFFTISSLSRGRNTLGSPTSLRIWLHLQGASQLVRLKTFAQIDTWTIACGASWTVDRCVKNDPWLTFWEQSQRPPCCTFGSCHQAVWWRCSWTCGQSWKCRLCKASLLGAGFLLAGNLASGPRPIPAGHILSCFPPVSANRLPYLEAEGKQRKRLF